MRAERNNQTLGNSRRVFAGSRSSCRPANASNEAAAGESRAADNKPDNLPRRESTLAEQNGPPFNALIHGLSAKSILPESLRLRTEELAGQLWSEFRPNGLIERLLVDRIAWHAAALEVAREGECAVMRSCSRERALLDKLLNPNGPADIDAAVAAAVGSQPLERIVRYTAQHLRGFNSAMSRLQELQAARKKLAIRAQFARFESESECAEYLRQRASERTVECPRCGNGARHWLARRCHWECSACGHQVGLRRGTVMEGSRLALRVWFKVIFEVLADPSIRPERLQSAIGLRRLGTVRTVLRRTLAAIESPDADRLLAGLQRFCPIGPIA